MSLRIATPLALAALVAAPAAFAEVTAAEAVRRPDGQVALTWTAAPGEAVDVLVSADPNAKAGAMKTAAAADKDGRELLTPTAARPYALLRTASGRPYHVAERQVPMAGASNFRDIGGYRTADGRQVRWGAIYRASALADLTPADYDAVRALRIKAIYDLRSVGERTSEPTKWVGADQPLMLAKDYEMDTSAFMQAFGKGVTVESARAMMTQFYPTVLDSHRDQFRAVFEQLLDPTEGAVLYHCTAGKDRTGVMTALVLTALGVPRETVIQDYLLSNTYYRPTERTLAANDPNAAFSRLPPEVTKVLMGVEPAYLDATFQEAERRHGSVAGYLEKELGVDAADIAALKARYTY